MDDYELECNNCGWQGYWTELVSLTEDTKDTNFSFCPDCASDDIEDIEHGDE